MQIVCPKCQRKYNVDSNKFEQVKRRNPRCKHCGTHLFDMDKDVETLVQPIDKRPPSVAPDVKPSRSSSPAKAPLPENLPKKIGPYSIRGVLGRGAMGYVYKGFDESLRRHVAIKVLSPELHEQSEFRKRFNVEAQALATLVHPNITQIYSAGQEGDQMYFAMEFVDGHPADDLLHRKGKFPVLEALHIVKQVCEGLKEAAAKEIIHRDIKPGNILIASDGVAKITDFGIAKIMKQDQSLTSTGMMIGTPAYTSPEQARGDKTDFRTDIYSLGATFYQLLVGRPPFEADSSVNVLMMHVTEPVRFPMTATGPVVPPQLTGIIRKMMAKKADDRYLNYNALLLDLSRIEAKLKEELGVAEPDEDPADLQVATLPNATVIADSQDGAPGTPVTFNRFVGEGPMALQYKIVLAVLLLGGGYWFYQKWQNYEPEKSAAATPAAPSGVKIESVRESVQPARAGPEPAVAPVPEPSGDLTQVTVIDSNIEKLEETTFRVFGSLRNLGTDKVRGVYVDVALNNLFDEVIVHRAIEAEPHVILPGEQARFSVLFKNVADVTNHTVEIIEGPVPAAETDVNPR